MSIIRHPSPGWVEQAGTVAAGSHVAVFTEGTRMMDVGVAGRLSGLHLRDTLLLLRSGPRASFVLLFRKPPEAATVLEQVVLSGAGTLNIGGSRPKAGRWPANVLLVHSPNCVFRGLRKRSQRTGTREIKQSVRSRPSLGFHEDGSHRQRVVQYETVQVPHFHYGEEDGFERVEDWDCQGNCPVRRIDLGDAEQAHYYLQFKDEEGA